MKSHRLLLNSCTLAVLLAFGAIECANAADDYPARPVKIIVPTGVGTGPDVTGRLIAEHLTQLWGKQVLVMNQPGAAGALAVRAAGTAAPDGYTLYFAMTGNFIAPPEIQSTLPFDLARDFVPIGFISEQPMLVGSSPQLGVKTLAELIALAKRRPGQINVGLGSARGLLPHLTAEWLSSASGTKMTMVHYAGPPQALADVAGGRIQVTIEALSVFAGPIASGSLKPLAVASERRLPSMPDLPTVAETLPGFVALGWFAMMAPPGTSQTVAHKISEDLRTVLARPELSARLAELGTFARPMAPDELRQFINNQQRLWSPVLAEVGLQAPK